MSRVSMLSAGLIASLGMVPALAADDSPPSGASILLEHCEIEYARSSLVGVAHMGNSLTTILQDCLVRPGDRVKAGQVLGRVMDRDIRAELELHTAEAENDIDDRVNQARYEEALNRLRRSETLQKRTFVSTEELNGHRLAMVTAQLETEQAKYRRRLAEIKRRQTEVLAHAREYISPHDGVVVEVQKQQGEAVSISEPIFRVVEVGMLKVSGFLNLADFWRVRGGQVVRVSAAIEGEELPIEREVFDGRVVFVDRRIDPTTRTCKVVAEVRNRDLLLASGLEARMEIFLDTPPTDRRSTGITAPSPAEPRDPTTEIDPVATAGAAASARPR